MSQRSEAQEVFVKIKGAYVLHLKLEVENMLIGGVARFNRYVHLETIKDARGNPYIPASSVKGRLRMLIETSYGLAGITSPDALTKSADERYTWSKLKERIPKDKREDAFCLLALFGGLNDVGPTRLIFHDLRFEGTPVTEIKPENMVDRFRGTAENPRLVERVSGVARGRLLILDVEPETEVEDKELRESVCPHGIRMLKNGFKLLKLLGLGRGVSRGYGKIKNIIIEKIERIDAGGSVSVIYEYKGSEDNIEEAFDELIQNMCPDRAQEKRGDA